MYPLNTKQPFLMNAWYVAASGDEIGRTVLARTILGEPIVFYRTEAGEPIALRGLCPHRLAPLDLGQLVGDTLRCGYHGFTYSPDGECIETPAATTRPERCRLKTYPLVEMGPWIWIWMGDSDAPDYSKLPDVSDIGLGNDAQGWRVDVAGKFLLQARSQLLIDNLFDLSHVAFLHATSFPAGASELSLLPPFAEELDGRFRVGRWLNGVPFAPDSVHGFFLPEETGNADLLMHTDLYNISFINGSGPWVWRSNDDGSRGEEIAKLNFVHCVTPETEHSTHYFGCLTRDIRLDDDEFSTQLIAQNDFIRSEDVVMLEAIEKRGAPYGDSRKEVSVSSDAGAIRVRRMIQAMFDAEALGNEAMAASVSAGQ